MRHAAQAAPSHHRASLLAASMAKGKKGADAAAAPAAAEPAGWECPECAQENEGGDDACCACDAPRPAAAAGAAGEASRFAGYAVGLVLTCDDVAGKDRLKKLTVDVGGGRVLTIATNAPNVAAGTRVVVATVGACVPDGAGGEISVKKAVVGGVASEGMLCDAPMLGWVGGGAGNAATVPDSFALGAQPPDKRPRMDGK